jgi:O-antigen/teichoic acid export membrane protein
MNDKTAVSPNRTVREVTFLWGSQLAAAGAAFLTQILLARALSVEMYGALVVALASVKLLIPLAGFGVGPYWLRIFGKEGWIGQRWISSTTKLVGLSSTAIVVAVLIWAWSGVFSTTTRILMSLLAVTAIGQAVSSIGGTVFQLETRYLAFALYHFLPHALRLAGAILAFTAGWSAFGVATGYALATLIIVVSYSRVLWRMLSGKLDLKGHDSRQQSPQDIRLQSIPSLIRAVQGAWPFAISGLFYLIYFQSDIALLGLLAGEKAAGIYSVAFSVMSVIYLFPGSIYQQYLMPHLHRWAEQDRSRFLQIYRFGGKTMLIASLGFMGLVAGLAPWIVPPLFGEAYSEAGMLLVFLSLCIPLRFLATNVGSILYTGDNMRRKVSYQGITAVFNVALNLVLIPVWGVIGAAMATVLTEAFVLLIYTLGVMRHVFGKAALGALGPWPIWFSVLSWTGIISFTTTRPNSLLISTVLVLGSLATAVILALKYVRPRFYTSSVER